MEKETMDFDKMVHTYKSTIYQVCYMFAKDNDEAADLFQEVLINLWQGLSSFKGQSSLKTWIWRISLNTCISFDRKKKRGIQTQPLEMDIDLFNDTDAETVQVKMLHDRISKLGVMDRAIVMLWLENLSYDEIGAIVGITAKNVSVKLVRIREQLKKMSN
ncbi:MAG: sigma-70 family RNA polymerase sigma factor [Paludibacteraceae bacterium]|nr:sigma-70 family RNA polymerase sigma factor [Paludibacteraceae bacterium]